MQSYEEGDWFLTPLRCGGDALGLIARHARGGGMLCYFFAPRLAEAPRQTELDIRRPAESAILICRCGITKLRSGAWQVIGKVRNWRRSDYPVPYFVPGALQSRAGMQGVIVYDDDMRDRRRVDVELQPGALVSEDVMSGAGAVEVHLTRILCPGFLTEREDILE